MKAVLLMEPQMCPSWEETEMSGPSKPAAPLSALSEEADGSDVPPGFNHTSTAHLPTFPQLLWAAYQELCVCLRVCLWTSELEVSQGNDQPDCRETVGRFCHPEKARRAFQQLWGFVTSPFVEQRGP